MYTEPEFGRVGLSEFDITNQGKTCQTYTYFFEDNDRAIIDGHPEGFVKIFTEKNSQIIQGATGEFNILFFSCYSGF